MARISFHFFFPVCSPQTKNFRHPCRSRRSGFASIDLACVLLSVRNCISTGPAWEILKCWPGSAHPIVHLFGLATQLLPLTSSHKGQKGKGWTWQYGQRWTMEKGGGRRVCEKYCCSPLPLKDWACAHVLCFACCFCFFNCTGFTFSQTNRTSWVKKKKKRLVALMSKKKHSGTCSLTFW